ncbi:hypothetical protein BAY61_22530 [Prauserella marina]|uniref:Prenyltransferase and squalene oxidase repeat-containing protein n=1 Tax=Prauserella marina TaxID=530584 RepID=A0A222VTQ8_9PSEU|nr:prenyltransferase/squalene oxidase repeat-containing protein [Prauserella marina]ASR37316.1 hypothetical protein BAY61_22530 [Prauserella marina]PWV74831.1 prenyltransferase/squalene oxidase-like repeat protein [Prauserella marina]SDD39573.1 Prenyltransferase and squalene oxidase repeat-containing protein [Prauserella marina]
MLHTLFENQGTTLRTVVRRALDYFRDHQRPDGAIAEDPAVTVFQEWDSVNALKAMALWSDMAETEHLDAAERIAEFLAGREKPNGMLSWGALPTGPGDYCTETSSEYTSALTLLGHVSSARAKAEYLRRGQLPSGAWEEPHPHIPRAFQTEPSVTGFASMALTGLDIEPRYVDEMLDFLGGRQKPDGHFGINWYYYGTYYYLLAPATAAQAAFGDYPALASARRFVVAEQRCDGSWHDELDGFGEYSSAEQHTALALDTLAQTGMDARETETGRAVTWLLGRARPDGSWNGGRYPYPDTDSYRGFHATQHVFTTARVLFALHALYRMENS